MKVLVINSGSSSIKYDVFDMRERIVLAAGVLERLGESASRLAHRMHAGADLVEEAPIKDHREGVNRITKLLASSRVVENATDLYGVGHRVVHGGAEFKQPTLIDDDVLQAIRRQIPLAPLHNPANLVGIEVMMEACPGTPQVAIFDTAFHHTIPPHAYQYALPWEVIHEHHIRRYGFHGTSHWHVAKEASRFLERPIDELNLIILHLGNGASATAVRAGQSIDTSMGMTPLEGLMMGTRSGDIDPGVLFHLASVTGQSFDQINTLLNRKSGLKGICGVNDMREVLRRAHLEDERAILAAEMYAYRIRKYIGAYMAVLPGVDAVVFTAGIGEHSAEIRAAACSQMEHLGISLNSEKNTEELTGPAAIHAARSQVQVLVIPTNEELEMAEQTTRCIQGEEFA